MPLFQDDIFGMKINPLLSYVCSCMSWFPGDMKIIVDKNPLDCSTSTWLFNPPPEVYVTTSCFPCTYPKELRDEVASKIFDKLTEGEH